MARKDKPGIKYFSQDSDHVLNNKVKLLFAEFDSHGPWVWECLKCEIYAKKGYYFNYSNPDELMLFASDVCKKQVSLVKEIINGCIRRELLDKRVFDMFGVLTSDRIQNNYLDGTREKRKKGYQVDLISEYMVVEIGQNERSIRFISVNGQISREKQSFSQEESNKGEERKGDEIKGEERKEEIFAPPTIDEVLLFFKEKKIESGWNDEKCKTEAANLVNYYAKTDWCVKNGKITNWQNAANGWIATDIKFELQKKVTGAGGKNTRYPDYYSKKFEATLPADETQKYWAYLRSLGFVPKKDRLQNTIDWEKAQ